MQQTSQPRVRLINWRQRKNTLFEPAKKDTKSDKFTPIWSKLRKSKKQVTKSRRKARKEGKFSCESPPRKPKERRSRIYFRRLNQIFRLWTGWAIVAKRHKIDPNVETSFYHSDAKRKSVWRKQKLQIKGQFWSRFKPFTFTWGQYELQIIYIIYIYFFFSLQNVYKSFFCNVIVMIILILCEDRIIDNYR